MLTVQAGGGGIRVRESCFQNINGPNLIHESMNLGNIFKLVVGVK